MTSVNENSGLLLQESRYNRLLEYVSSSIDGFEIVDKKDSMLMKLLSFLLFFNKSFMTNYVTTMYPKIYVPSLPWHPNSPIRRISTLAHEYVHLRDRKRMGLLFNFLYLSPQIFSLLAVGAFWNLWWLLALLFLLPIPSPGRAWLEYRGYRMTMAMHWYVAGLETNVAWVEQQFTSSNYYWMMPFKKFIGSRLVREFENIKAGKNLPQEIFEIKQALGIET
jgi:hypothetical protein